MTIPIKRLAIIAVVALAICALLLWSRVASMTAFADPLPVEPTIEEPKIDPELQHRRETWLSALEWCESRGYKEKAINPNDKDGTPSYYAFQFKPSTFKYYTTKYGLLSTGLEDADYFNLMSDYELMRETVRRMIDDPKVQWSREFPDCVLRHVGYPPVK